MFLIVWYRKDTHLSGKAFVRRGVNTSPRGYYEKFFDTFILLWKQQPHMRISSELSEI